MERLWFRGGSELRCGGWWDGGGHVQSDDLPGIWAILFCVEN